MFAVEPWKVADPNANTVPSPVMAPAGVAVPTRAGIPTTGNARAASAQSAARRQAVVGVRTEILLASENEFGGYQEDPGSGRAGAIDAF